MSQDLQGLEHKKHKNMESQNLSKIYFYEKKSRSTPNKDKQIDLAKINFEQKLYNNFNKNKIDFLKTSNSDTSNALLTDNTVNTFSKTAFSYGFASLVKSKYLLLVSILFLSLSVLFIKILFQSQNDNIHSHNTLNFFCGFYMFIFSIIFIKVDNINFTQKKNFNKSELDYLLIRALSGFFSIHFTIRALSKMRLVSATTLIYLSPVYSTYFLMLHKREKLRKYDKICFFFSLMIIFIFIIQDYFYSKVLEDDNFQDSLIGVFYCVIAAILNSINNVIDRKVSTEFHSYTILFVTGAFSIILTPIFMSISQDKFFMSTRNFILFILLGASLFFGSYFNQKTIEANTLNINSSLHNITIVLAYIYTFFIFDEPFTSFDVLSTLMVILLNFYMKLRAEECETNDNTDNL